MLWILYSFCACFIYSLNLITTKYLTNIDYDKYLDIYAYLSFFMAGIICFFLLLNNRKRALTVIHQSKKVLLLFLISIFLISTRYFILKAINNTSKIANITLIINFSVIIVLLISIFLFKKYVSFTNIIGIIIALIGLMIIILDK
jgi:drug/metabolite transporter (DMT)-like permease